MDPLTHVSIQPPSTLRLTPVRRLLDSPIVHTEHPNWFKRAAKQYFSSKDQLLTLGYAAFGPEFNTVEGNQADWKLAREVDARITIHVGVGTFFQEWEALER